MMFSLVLMLYVWSNIFHTISGHIPFTVSVINTDPLERDIFLPSQTASLRCSVSPQPPGSVVYHWRSSVQDLLLLDSSGLQDQTQEITFQVLEEYPTEARVFCHVLDGNDDSYLGTGHALIKIQGLLSSRSATSTDATQQINLKADRTYNYSFRILVQPLAPNVNWYYNGTIPVEDLRSENLDGPHSITSSAVGGPRGSHTLSIMHPRINDSGIYTAKIWNILTDQNNCNATLSCDDIFIPLLSHSAVTRPIAYKVEVQDSDVSYTPIPAALHKIPHFLSHFMDHSAWSIEINVPLIELPANLSGQQSTLAIYHNGQRIWASAGNTLGTPRDTHIPTPYNFSSEVDITNSKAVVTLRIPRTQTHDEGIYEIVFLSSLFPGNFSCCPNYYRLLTDFEGFGMEYFVNGLAVVELRLAGRPDVRLHVEKRNITMDEETKLACHIHSLNGLHIKKFQLKKNSHIILSNSTGTTFSLEASTADAASPFGNYFCEVSNGYYEVNKVALISEKVEAVYYLQPLDNSPCDITLRDSAETYMSSLLNSTLQSLCDCELTADNLFNKSVNCDPTTSVMTFSMSVAFANHEGTILASDLLQQAEQWVLGERDIDGTSLLVMSTLDEGDNLSLSGSEVLIALIAGCIAAGGLLGLLIGCFLIWCVYVAKKHKKARPHTKTQPLPQPSFQLPPLHSINFQAHHFLGHRPLPFPPGGPIDRSRSPLESSNAEVASVDKNRRQSQQLYDAHNETISDNSTVLNPNPAYNRLVPVPQDYLSAIPTASPANANATCHMYDYPSVRKSSNIDEDSNMSDSCSGIYEN